MQRWIRMERLTDDSKYQDMILNYFKVAFRNLVAYKFYSLINILGLTISLTCSALIVVYIMDELSYDRFHRDADKTYRVGITGSLAGQKFDAVTTCAPMSAALKIEFPEVEEVIRINNWTNVNVSYEDRVFTEKSVLLADSNFFEFWDFKLLEGDPHSVLRGINHLVISENAAIKYFDWKGPGDTSPIGKILQIGTGDRTCTVAGISENAPSNSHFRYDMILSMHSWEYSKDVAWTSNSFYTYFKKNPQVDISETQLKLDGLVEKYVGPEIEQYIGMSLEEFRKNGDAYAYWTQPLTDIRLRSDHEGEMMPGGNMAYLYVFGAVAVFIILLACINFMNLATARSASRAKEVGIRKTIGASRTKLTWQFLTESILFSLISVLPSILLIYALLGPFNTISGKELEFDLFSNPVLYGGLLGLAVFMGLLAGIYPAFYLTSFKPVDVLKGKVRAGFKSGGLRGVLVVFQFCIGISLIICTLIVFKQLDMMQKRNLGFEKENLLVIDNARKLGDNKRAFKEELKKYEDVLNASISSSYPPYIYNNTVFQPMGGEDQLFFVYEADEDHLATLGYEITEGRYFEESRPSDSLSLLLNEAAMRQLSWTKLDQQKFHTFWRSDEGMDLELIGVVKDFNFESLKQNVRPLAMVRGSQGNIITVRLAPGDVTSQVALIEKKWKEIAAEAAFEYTFLDQEFDSLFRAEQRLGKLAIIFTSLAVFVACLGLFGLATFTAEQRAKEIGIRKVMGASVNKIVLILSQDFTKLVLIAFALAIPISYFAMDYWLQDFAYKISIGVSSFVLAGFGAVLISWLTVGYQSYKAASSNPVKSLRSE